MGNGFDFSRRLHFFNVGEAEHRSWDDCRIHGFLSAGYGERYKQQARQLQAGDLVVAYLSNMDTLVLAESLRRPSQLASFASAKPRWRSSG